jgi:lactoylglutathione lyase
MRPILFALLALTSLAAQEPRRPKILGVAHVAFAVSDIGKARAFYKDLLGYGEPFWLEKPSGELDLTFIKVNDRQYIELFTGLKPGDDRLRHVAIETDDAEGMRLYLKSKGVAVPERVPKGRTRNSNFNVKDPDGHTIEIVEYEPDSWTSRHKGSYMGASRVSKRILHAGVIVQDLEAAMKFYRDTLGFREFWRGAARDSQTLSWVNMRVPDGDDYIEFMLYKDLPPGDRRGSAHHVCLEVDDIEAALKQVEAKPARKTYERPLEIRTGINRRRQLNLFDPDGTRSELMEPRTVDGHPAPSSTLPPPR